MISKKKEEKDGGVRVIVAGLEGSV